ncbi:MAG: hypothetical protein ACKPKO_08960 [Candidatus Fonsibacter sp.]
MKQCFEHKRIDVGSLDEAQSYDLDQALAITAMPRPQNARLNKDLACWRPTSGRSQHLATLDSSSTDQL